MFGSLVRPIAKVLDFRFGQLVRPIGFGQTLQRRMQGIALSIRLSKTQGARAESLGMDVLQIKLVNRNKS